MKSKYELEKLFMIIIFAIKLSNINMVIDIKKIFIFEQIENEQKKIMINGNINI